MSQQSTPLEASGLGIDVLRGIKSAFARTVAALHANRQAEARRIVRGFIAHHHSDEDLARYGWSPEDIRRLKYE